MRACHRQGSIGKSLTHSQVKIRITRILKKMSRGDISYAEYDQAIVNLPLKFCTTTEDRNLQSIEMMGLPTQHMSMGAILSAEFTTVENGVETSDTVTVLASEAYDDEEFAEDLRDWDKAGEIDV